MTGTLQSVILRGVVPVGASLALALPPFAAFDGVPFAMQASVSPLSAPA